MWHLLWWTSHLTVSLIFLTCEIIWSHYLRASLRNKQNNPDNVLKILMYGTNMIYYLYFSYFQWKSTSWLYFQGYLKNSLFDHRSKTFGVKNNNKEAKKKVHPSLENFCFLMIISPNSDFLNSSLIYLFVWCSYNIRWFFTQNQGRYKHLLPF